MAETPLKTNPGQAFDVIVVGGGSAGCVLASRLSENAQISVLLLEAGAARRPLVTVVPGLMAQAIASPDLTWRFVSQANPDCAGRSIACPTGRGLGGSTLINGMVFCRGLPDDYDGWGDLGDVSWGWRDLLPCFRSIETWAGRPSPSRGADGPLRVGDIADPHPLSAAFVNAASHFAPRVADYNGGVDQGVGFTQTNQHRGRRHSTRDAFLPPGLQRPNLTILTHAEVTRVDVRGGRARGVLYVQGGHVHRAEARSEVVLCAGAIGSAKLLLLSGVGPGRHLEDHGIEVAHDSPNVGANLQDHTGISLVYATRGPSYNRDSQGWRRLAAGARWLLTAQGPAATPANQAQMFAKTDPGLASADVQMQFCPIGYGSEGGEVSLGETDAVTIGVSLCRPTARGRVSLTSADPRSPPRIELPMLKSAADRRALIRAGRLARDLCRQSELARHLKEEISPSLSASSDEDWERFIAQHASTFYHLTGACAMGPDVEAVCDSSLRVNGVEGLSVADASVMPRLTSANTNGPVMAIAERAAHLISARLGTRPDAPHATRPRLSVAAS